MSATQGSTNILKIIDNYDIVVYDVENVNPNKKLLVLDSNKGKVLLQKYNGSSKQLWLAYNVFKTLMGNDVLKITKWYITADGAPFIEANDNLYYLTRFQNDRPTAEVALTDHLSFLAKWHYLSREIVYARDFADSLTTPRPIHQHIETKQVGDNSYLLKKVIIDKLKGLDLYKYPEKKLTITLPMFNIKRLVKVEDDCLFQPWQQIYKWNWQIVDIANILCFFKFDNIENVKEGLKKYNQLNPLSAEEWKALPNLMLWNLCTEVNYELVSDSYFEFYEQLCSVIEEISTTIPDKIILPISQVNEINTIETELIEESVNIVVVNPQEEEIAYNVVTNNNVVQFNNSDKKQQEEKIEEIPQEIEEADKEIVLEPNEKEIEVTTPEVEKPNAETNEEAQEEAKEVGKEVTQEDYREEAQEETKPKDEEKKAKLESLTWKPFPEPIR